MNFRKSYLISLVKLHALEVKIKHYHADGGKELISKAVISKLQKEGSRYTWTPADTPELNSTQMEDIGRNVS